MMGFLSLQIPRSQPPRSGEFSQVWPSHGHHQQIVCIPESEASKQKGFD
jgi:hypothetical protein